MVKLPRSLTLDQCVRKVVASAADALSRSRSRSRSQRSLSDLYRTHLGPCVSCRRLLYPRCVHAVRFQGQPPCVGCYVKFRNHGELTRVQCVVARCGRVGCPLIERVDVNSTVCQRFSVLLYIVFLSRRSRTHRPTVKDHGVVQGI